MSTIVAQPQTEVQSISAELKELQSYPPFDEMEDYVNKESGDQARPILESLIEEMDDTQLEILRKRLQDGVYPQSISHKFGEYEVPYFGEQPSLICQNPHAYLSIVDTGSDAYARLKARGHIAEHYGHEIIITESDASLRNRIKGWILGFRNGPKVLEEILEHEVRHDIFEKAIFETNTFPEMNEGFAMATGGIAIDHPDISIYRFRYDRHAIASYRDLFLYAQAKGCDEVGLLEHMVKEDFWGSYVEKGDYDYLVPAKIEKILVQARQYIESNSTERQELSEEDTIQNYRRELYKERIKWKYQILKIFTAYQAKLRTEKYYAKLEERYKT